jgi:ectoine hydroxylase-related dioxygenase (phytanoyl-CoA dioxygenase family)
MLAYETVVRNGIDQLHGAGFLVVEAVLTRGTIEQVLAEIAQVEPPVGARPRDHLYALRQLMERSASVRELAASDAVRSLVEPILGSDAFPVQAIFFDKPPQANWKVPWHQDLTIPVREWIDVPGFGPWSVKAGVPHVQPPVDLLERMLIVRLHLDASTEENGPLRVIPGSHRHGRLPHSEIQHWQERGGETACLVPRSGALLMRPLLLHASSAARVPAHRRVIHLEYAADPLPGGLEWA